MILCIGEYGKKLWDLRMLETPLLSCPYYGMTGHLRLGNALYKERKDTVKGALTIVVYVKTWKI